MNSAKPVKNKADEAPMLAELDQYIAAACQELEVSPDFAAADRDDMLKLTGIAAHNLVRPAAPFSALLAGYLVGSGKADSWQSALGQVRELIAEYLEAGAESAE